MATRHQRVSGTAVQDGERPRVAQAQGWWHVHWTMLMSLPARPPMLFTALPAAPAALEMPELADDEAFERPCEAWVAPLEAALAASEVVEAWRTAMRPIWGARRSIRDAERDMMKAWRNNKGVGWGRT